MSGIGGVRTFSAGACATEVLEAMAETLHHRGPDESAVWVGPDIGLTHTRLAITDVEHSHQPMRSVDGRWVLALDGEIFNHEALRAHLDYPFRTQGDTEVVVAGLALEGISFVERLHGQFALVAHDLRTDTTHLVRDRLGVLPLHYRHVPGGIAFASEVKALLALGPPPRVDHRSLDAYLETRTVPAPDTLFEGVKKVRPAHRVALMPRGHLEETRYWVPPECDPEGTWTAGDVIESVGDGVREAVRSALVADVPVGAHLSGRLDSSLVVAEVQQVRGDERVPTFSVGFDTRVGDDLARTRRVAELMGTDHHEVRLRAADFEDLWGRLTWHRDAPISEPGDIAMFALAQSAHEHVGVLLSGEGGDELFGRPTPGLTRLAASSALLPARWRTRTGAASLRQRGATFSAAERARLLGGASPPARRATSSLGVDPADSSLRDDVRHWVPDHLLERGDRLSMAGSVAWRPPLLDHHLVELALRLPTSARMRAGSAQWILREVARPIVPEEALETSAASRPPLDPWFRTGLRDTAHDLLTGSGSWVGRTLDRAFVQQVVERHERGSNEEARLFALLGLEMWHHSFFGAGPVVPRQRRSPSPVPTH